MFEAIKHKKTVHLIGNFTLDSIESFDPSAARCGNPALPPNDDEILIRQAINAMPLDHSGRDGWSQVKRRIGDMVIKLARDQFEVGESYRRTSALELEDEPAQIAPRRLDIIVLVAALVAISLFCVTWYLL